MKIVYTLLIAALTVVDLSIGQNIPCHDNHDCPASQCCVRIWITGRCRSRRSPHSRWCHSATRICDNSFDCWSGECCRLNAHRQGECHAKPLGAPETFHHSMFCPPDHPTTCQSKADCGLSNCCRMNATGQGECVHYSDEGKACSTGSSTGLVDICPCAIGLKCKTPEASSTGVCQSHVSECTTHSDCKRRNTCCKSFGRSTRRCVTAVDHYGKCGPVPRR